MNKWSNYGKWRHPKERNKYMNTLDKKYQDLLQDILDNGVEKTDRTGTGTISVFGRQIRHKMSEGFPLLTTKKMPFKTIVTELLWFLRGDTNIKFLVDNNCHIWDGDAIKNWMSSTKCYKFRRNLYIETKLEIILVDEVSIQDFPYVNSDGYYVFEKDGIEELWVDFSKFDENNYILRKFISDSFIYKIKTDDEFAKTWGELGPIYGKQWRKWRGPDGYDWNTKVSETSIDQIANLINDLKTNPDSRRLMVNAWNVGELDQMVLPPCHYGFQVYTRELSLEERWKFYYKRELDIKRTHGEWDSFEDSAIKNLNSLGVPVRAISLMFNMRSNDVPLGLPFNIASYALLLEIIGKMVNMIPDELIINLGDAHIYKNQVDGVKEQLTREPFELPKLVISNQINFNGSVNEFLNSCLITDFIVENYQSHPTIKIPLSN
jgi:thymidylate synthase